MNRGNQELTRESAKSGISLDQHKRNKYTELTPLSPIFMSKSDKLNHSPNSNGRIKVLSS